MPVLQRLTVLRILGEQDEFGGRRLGLPQSQLVTGGARARDLRSVRPFRLRDLFALAMASRCHKITYPSSSFGRGSAGPRRSRMEREETASERLWQVGDLPHFGSQSSRASRCLGGPEEGRSRQVADLPTGRRMSDRQWWGRSATCHFRTFTTEGLGVKLFHRVLAFDDRLSQIALKSATLKAEV